MNYIGKSQDERTYDAIVIGSGMSGGYAAKELCDNGGQTLVLERGWPVKHGDYPTAMKDPWEIDNAGRLPQEMLEKNPIIAKCYAFDKTTEHFFVKNIRTRDNNQVPGLDIHEMDGVRMGKDPKSSILNKWNQVHSCKMYL